MGPARVGSVASAGLPGHARESGQADPRADAPSAAARNWPLTIVTWNVHVGGGAMRTFLDHLTNTAMSGSGGSFVLLLQEAYAAGPPIPPFAPSATSAERITESPKSEARTDIVSFARDAGLSLFYAPSMRNGEPEAPFEDRGNAILSNLPLAELRAIELPFERQRRVTLTAQVIVAGTAVSLCCAHLDNRAPWRKAWRGLGLTQARQVKGLLRTLPGDQEAEGTAPAGPEVFAGDLNTWFRGRRQAAHKLVRASFPLPPRPDPRPTQHFEIAGWLRTVDYLMARTPPGWRFDYRRQDDTFGSDHYPLVGTLAPE